MYQFVKQGSERDQQGIQKEWRSHLISYIFLVTGSRESRQIISHQGISLKYQRITKSLREQAFIALNIRGRR